MPTPSRTTPRMFASHTNEQVFQLIEETAAALLAKQPDLDLDDIIGDTGLRVTRNAHRFDPSLSSLRTWIWNICRTSILDALRARKGQKPLFSTEASSYYESNYESGKKNKYRPRGRPELNIGQGLVLSRIAAKLDLSTRGLRQWLKDHRAEARMIGIKRIPSQPTIWRAMKEHTR